MSRTRLFEWHRRFKELAERRWKMITGVRGHPQAEQKKMLSMLGCGVITVLLLE